mmetsp:Transcript_90052/g.160348  ORF Transcript_90052/g.160348 Transcript_90052/m.160348 type:complete len:133 (+) Transcript_90052:48-446(+)
MTSMLTMHAEPPCQKRLEAGHLQKQKRPVPVTLLPFAALEPEAACPTSPSKAEVRFRSPMVSPHAITPYSKVYGCHPSLFEFNAKGEMEVHDFEQAFQAMRRQSKSEPELPSITAMRRRPSYSELPLPVSDM